jgi:hypothetical protein
MTASAEEPRSALLGVVLWIQRLAVAEVVLGLASCAVAASVASGRRDYLLEGLPPSLVLVAVTLYLAIRLGAKSGLWMIVTVQVLWAGFIGLYGSFPTGSLGALTLVPLLACLAAIVVLAPVAWVRRAGR